MPDIITLEAAKKHLRVSGTADDAQIGTMLIAAAGAVEGLLGRPLIGENGWPTVADIPAEIGHAIKLVLGHLFEFRETTLAGPNATELTIGGRTTLELLLQRHTRVSIA